MSIVRSFDVNRPGSTIEELAGGEPSFLVVVVHLLLYLSCCCASSVAGRFILASFAFLSLFRAFDSYFLLCVEHWAGVVGGSVLQGSVLIGDDVVLYPGLFGEPMHTHVVSLQTEVCECFLPLVLLFAMFCLLWFFSRTE